MVQSMRGAVPQPLVPGRKKSRKLRSEDDTDSDSDDETEFDTDATHDLMSQLKDYLSIAVKQGWDIFHDSSGKSGLEKTSDSFLRKRGVASGRRRSRSRSRSRSNVLETEIAEQIPRLLSVCISVVASVIREDCRYRSSTPRLIRPPNALQAATLDVAQFLVHAHRDDSHVSTQIAYAVIPAFYTFEPKMHARLLAFFDDVVLGTTLHLLAQSQGLRQGVSPIDLNNRATSAETLKVSITVDEAQDHMTPLPQSSGRWRRWTSPENLREQDRLRSNNAPYRSSSEYQLAAIIPAVLAAICDTVDPSSDSLPTMHRFHRLLERMADSKPDVYLDILSVIAHHTPRARSFAIAIIMSYWPKAIGHLAVTKPFPILTYSDTIHRAAQGPTLSRRPHDNPYSHQFMPWFFRSNTIPSVFEGMSQRECRSCSEMVDGYGLLCPLCMCAVHFDCYDYPEGSFLTEYVVVAEPGRQKVAVHRFSHILPNRREGPPVPILVEHHSFRLVNMFTLTLCFLCRQPLWGCTAQAFKCASCRQFVHSSCLSTRSTVLPRCRSVSIDDTYMSIDWSIMRHSFADHYGELFLTEEELSSRSYEEISIFHAVLGVQLQIYNNGVALGSIVIVDDDQGGAEEFELHYLVNLYDAYLTSGRALASGPLAEYIHNNDASPSHARFLFDWNTLAFITSVLKMPLREHSAVTSDSSDLLSASHVDHDNTGATVEDMSPCEIVSIAHLRDQLAEQLRVFSDAAARYLLDHLGHIGFIQRLDLQANMCHSPVHAGTILSCFPLPLGLDVSTEVESLVTAIEACLTELDLSVNEFGFLLLVRRFWPDGMLTEYALHRLSRIVISWILLEDDNLAIILRDFVAQGRSLPGVRFGSEAQPWPYASQSRTVRANSANNGGDYVASRRALLSRYATRWMLALHDQNIQQYATLIFDLLTERAEENAITDDYLTGLQSPKNKSHVIVTDQILRMIIKLCQVSVIFTAFDDLFKKWLDRAYGVSIDHEEPITSLNRLFNREVEASQRFSAIIDPRQTLTDATSLANVNALRTMTDIATSNKDGFQQAIHWLCLFLRSGVDIPIPIFQQFSNLAQRFGATLEDCSVLVKATLWSAWLKSLGRQELQSVISVIQTYVTAEIVSCLQSRHNMTKIICLVRQSLATCLLLYGCDRTRLIKLGMIQEEDIAGLPPRRKLNSRASTVADPVIVNANLMEALKAYVETKAAEVVCIVAKFLNAFMMDAPLVEAYEVDNFILRNGATLCTCVWRFYDTQSPDLAATRASLLSRILSVDTLPFQTLLREIFDVRRDWELRVQSVLRLFRVILDITNPSLAVGDRQWRSGLIDIFQYFFSSMWRDEREEVRLTVETWSRSLLPAHLEAISLCWSEALTKSSVAERTKLVSFLNQLHPYFPQWKLLSWDSVIEALLENDYVQTNDEDGPAAAHLSMYGLSSKSTRKSALIADDNLSILRASLLSLAIHMISDGVPIDSTSLLKLKEHVARTLGFQSVLREPSTGHGFYITFSDLEHATDCVNACLNDMITLLDSSQPHDIAPSTMGGPYVEDDTPYPMLIGSTFVDVILEFCTSTENLESLSSIALKNLLKLLIIMLYKHDFESKPIRHLQMSLRKTCRRVLDLLLCNVSYDVRQLVFSVSQSFIKRWPMMTGSFICESIELTSGLMISLEFQHRGDDILVDAAKKFLESILSTYATGGIFHILCKRRLVPDFFLVIKYVVASGTRVESKSGFPDLRETLLRDTMMRAIENDNETYQQVITNISSYVEAVYHTGYSAEFMQFVGLCLMNMIRRTADWPADAFDPCPLFNMASILVQHNKAQSRELLTFMETLLRASLIRFHVTSVALIRMIQVTSRLFRQRVSATPAALAANPILFAILEILSEGLRGKTRVLPSTLAALLEATTATLEEERQTSGSTMLSHESVVRLAEDGLFFLCNEVLLDSTYQADFTASQAVTKLILAAAEVQPSIFAQLSTTPPSVRAWNLLVLAALSSQTMAPTALLFDQFPAFSFAYSVSLQPYQDPLQVTNIETQDLAHADISRAYAALKLWILLAHKIATGQQGVRTDGPDNPIQNTELRTAQMIWNELWPPFDSAISTFELDAQLGQPSPITATVWTSVADLFLFLRQSRSVVAQDRALETRVMSHLKTVVRNEAKKLSRITKNMNEIPPSVSLEAHVNQVTREIWAEERLQAAKRQDAMSERGRRVAS
ncbi:hypothetical protein CERSUDRAFT_113558 [Gelatoporia subvermispora B]|uniref:Phorbol-ester/DAG-type domain-containing protein n=1 Tax=Ceriporiopsis subvermispora (strain B) TaxID=914234 RepID=M2QN02_CERS8|nr:hypothetical protein CERSUDRAFT_113558 [Gelatoporia subvermispora B]